jgi:hypothetical protein
VTAGVLDPHCVSGEAEPDHSHVEKHHLRSAEREKESNWARVMTNLIVQLSARVGKSRATPICPFLFHLYERYELLRGDEEKAWRIQEAMMKYGESGSDDEAGSGSGYEDEDVSEPEEEEETAVLLNRPPKRAR